MANPENMFTQFGGNNSTEIDYGDVPENMDEEQMRAYLALESKIVMPNQEKRDSFEAEWKNKRNKYSNNHPSQNNKNKNQSNNQYNYQQPQQHQQQQQQQQKQSNFNYNKTNNNTITNINNNTYQNDNNYMVDRMSTVTMVSNKSGNHRREHSFKKQNIMQQQMTNLPQINQSMPQNNNNNTANFPYNSNMTMQPNQQQNGKNKENQSAVSALSKQIKPTQHQQQQSGINTNTIQSRNADNKLVIKQMPYSKKSHAMVNIHVEISADHIEHIIVHFFKHYSVEQFLEFLKNDTNNGAFKDCEIEIFIADDDGDLDDDFPAPELKAIIANLGLKHFYIKISNINNKKRNDIRRTTLSYKSSLMTTHQLDTLHSLEEIDEYSDEESSGKCCIIL
eukprot:129697_1